MKKSWGLIPKILSGQKTIESRWYKARIAPWDRIKAGETVYFKNGGEPVTAKAEVANVLQFADLDQSKAIKIIKDYGWRDLGFTGQIPPEVQNYVEGKKYCLLVFLKNPRLVEPFEIDKSGFGLMAAWVVVDNISDIITSK